MYPVKPSHHIPPDPVALANEAAGLLPRRISRMSPEIVEIGMEEKIHIRNQIETD